MKEKESTIWRNGYMIGFIIGWASSIIGLLIGKFL